MSQLGIGGITFVGNVTSIPADWANQVNTLVFDVFGAAATKAGALNALGLGSMATQEHGAVNIEGGTIDGVTIGSSTPAAGIFSVLRVNDDTGNDPTSVVSRTGVAIIAQDQLQHYLNTLLFARGDLLVRGDLLERFPSGDNGNVLLSNSDAEAGIVWRTFTHLAERNPSDDPGQYGFAGDLLVRTATEYIRMPVGPDGSLLIADSSQPQGMRWSTSNLLLPLRAKGDLLTYDAGATMRLPVGADGQVLVADQAEPGGLKWTNIVFPTLTAKGDLLTRTAAGYTVLHVGATGSLLVADPSQATGLRWAAANTLNPLAAKGDLMTHNGTTAIRLAVGTTNQVLVPRSSADGGLAWANIRSTLPLSVKGDILVDTGAALAKLPVGANGKVLVADSAQPIGLKWDDPVSAAAPLTTKGDLFGFDGAVNVRVPAGSNGQILTSDPTTSTGLRWANASGATPAQLTAQVLASVAAGGIQPGQLLPVGMTFQQFVEALIAAPVPPVYVQPTMSMTVNYPPEGLYEVGMELQLEFTPHFVQNDAGAPVQQRMSLNGSNIGTEIPMGVYTNTIEVSSFGTRFRMSMEYDQGPLKNDSIGNPYPAGRIQGGTKETADFQYYGIRKAFFGPSLGGASYLDQSYQFRQLPQESYYSEDNPNVDASGAQRIGHPTAIPNFIVEVPPHSTTVFIAVPASSRAIASIRYVELSDAETKDDWLHSLAMVEGANGFSPIVYNVYRILPPDSAFVTNYKVFI